MKKLIAIMKELFVIQNIVLILGLSLVWKFTCWQVALGAYFVAVSAVLEAQACIKRTIPRKHSK